ncbi:MAG: YccF domain-containing protein [Thermomicrobiales bacterium]|nr:YccF domain-containing protein [Thermomicrobiales bacterium]
MNETQVGEASVSGVSQPLQPQSSSLSTVSPSHPQSLEATPSPYIPPATPTQQITNVATTVNVGGPTIVFATNRKKRSFIVRAIWFCFIGFWLSGLFILAGYFFLATIIGAPLGFWFLNRVPQAQTLREKNSDLTVTSKDGITYVSESTAEQYPWYLRALYFPVGLVAGLLWLGTAYLLSLFIVPLPLSIWMIDRAPTVITLEKY